MFHSATKLIDRNRSSYIFVVYVHRVIYSVCNCFRLLFVTARNDHMPEVFGMVHVDTFSPVPASILLVLKHFKFLIDHLIA